ncbi:hypothetical protein HHK36_016709 [Tetracentron sinense]|uniref:beta-galactosidase n=1 Tax=Tetracentron sinense TaxID=13715 RepID=A0A835DC63_TETSI|nr:hypothetical protein HHK36_016709 [Tetracentron sinense]
MSQNRERFKSDTVETGEANGVAPGSCGGLESLELRVSGSTQRVTQENGFPTGDHRSSRFSGFGVSKAVTDVGRAIKIMEKGEYYCLIENEYGNVISSYGDVGKTYLNWCANTAESLDIGVPWIMCQENDAPQPMINTCNGWYYDSFTPNNPNSPKMWTANWTGWFKGWGSKDPHRTAEDVAFAVGRFFQVGGTFQNYYMYHGGTNFGRTARRPYIATSYDYDAPLDEYGNLNQPKWGHLKELHLILKSMEKILTHGDVNTIDYGNSVSVTVYTLNETSSCFFGNANWTSDGNITFQGNQYTVPAWSVTILPDCKKEVYNTARVNTQTSVMVKKINRVKMNLSASNGYGGLRSSKILFFMVRDPLLQINFMEQKAVANDAIHIDGNDLNCGKEMTLKVNTTGPVLHAYVNGKYLDGISSFVFEKEAKMKPGRNQITLLSVTVGLKNYGAKFDLVQAGIVGLVELVGHRRDDEYIISNKWVYKVGLNGEEKQLTALNQGMILLCLTWKGWVKNMLGVNGESIGRFWPSFLADEDGCADTCNFRRAYDNNKCVTNCGQPSQIWYHVPRSFLQINGTNTLVLFEEMGINPSLVNFQTVTVGSACGNVYEGNKLELSCHGGQTISDIRFASFGDPQGTCGSFKEGSCTAKNSLSTIQKVVFEEESHCCLGLEQCQE